MKTYRINQVSKMTGLSKEVLRVWEKRYRLVSPQRGPNRYRLYTDEDLKLLNFLVREIEMGQSIGELASLGKDEIWVRINEEERKESNESSHPTDPLIKELENYLMPLDQVAFEKRLKEITVLLPFEEVFNRVLIPLQIRIGELWFDGKVGIAVEHYVTTQVKQKLFAVMNMMSVEKGPKVVIACPPWELHEIGAQIIAYHCSSIGCQATLLGANLPQEDLIHFCNSTQPDAVILSFTSPVSENRGRIFFSEISNHISSFCPVFIGGQGITGTEYYLDYKEINYINKLSDLESFLIK